MCYGLRSATLNHPEPQNRRKQEHFRMLGTPKSDTKEEPIEDHKTRRLVTGKLGPRNTQKRA